MARYKIGISLIILLLSFPILIHADIRIFGLIDFDFGTWNLGDGPLRSNSNICVSVRPRGPYQVTAYGSGTSNGFDTLPYRLFYNDRPRPNGATELQSGSVLGGLRGPRRGLRQQQCNRPNANIAINFSNRDLTTASAGQYRGILTIVVGPE